MDSVFSGKYLQLSAETYERRRRDYGTATVRRVIGRNVIILWFSRRLFAAPIPTTLLSNPQVGLAAMQTVKFRVSPFVSHQLLMTSGLNDPAFLHDQNPIRHAQS